MPERVPHTLVVRAPDAGFFSNVNLVVNRLRHSLGRDGCEAVRVDWRLDGPVTTFTYGTPADGNLWERFFAPLAFPGAPAAERTTEAYADYGMTGLRAYRMYKRGGDWRRAYGRAWAEHVRVRPEIVARVDEIWRAGMEGRFCVGVHVRHTDHSHECPRPIPEPAVFAERASRLAARAGRDAAVVLATDAPSAVEAFGEAFGERLVLQPGVERERARRGPPQVGMPEPRVELGVQALIDALLLARCDVLLHSVSNLATAAGYMSPAMPMVYCEPRRAHVLGVVRARITPAPPPESPVGMSHLQRQYEKRPRRLRLP